MQSLKRFLSTSFGSAVAGGLVVLVVGLILIQAGAVDTSDNNSAPVIQPAALARPASSQTAIAGTPPSPTSGGDRVRADRERMAHCFES